jgi:hypothetical protein
MMAITVRQPYAEMICLGAKKSEQRTWPLPAKFRGEWLALHAAAKPDTAANADDWRTLERAGVDPDAELPLGAVVALVRFGPSEEAADAMHAWPVLEVRRVTPMWCRGALGFWRVPEDIAADLERARLAEIGRLTAEFRGPIVE